MNLLTRSASLSPLSGRAHAARSRCLVLLLALGLGATWVAEASAVEPPTTAAAVVNKSPAKVDIQTVEVKMKTIAKKMAKDGWQHPVVLGEIETLLVDIQTRLARIAEKDKAWDLAPYQAFFDEAVEKWQGAAQAQADVEQAATRELEVRSHFGTLGDRHGRAIAAGFRVVDEEVPGELDDIVADWKALDGLAQLAEECEKLGYLDIQKYYTSSPRNRQPEQVCTLAAVRGDLKKDFVPLAAAARLKDQLAVDKKALDALVADGSLSEDLAARFADPAAHAKRVATEFGDVVRASGVKVAASHFQPVETQAKTFGGLLAAAARVDRFPKDWTANDAKLSGEVQASVKAAGASLVRFRLAAASPWITKSDIGIPLVQWNTAAVVTRFTGESYCRLSTSARFEGTYKSGGTYAPLSYVGGGLSSSYRVTACPK